MRYIMSFYRIRVYRGEFGRDSFETGTYPWGNRTTTIPTNSYKQDDLPDLEIALAYGSFCVTHRCTAKISSPVSVTRHQLLSLMDLPERGTLIRRKPDVLARSLQALNTLTAICKISQKQFAHLRLVGWAACRVQWVWKIIHEFTIFRSMAYGLSCYASPAFGLSPIS
jgi:hypothetical protein